ncbi:hypothetical protein V5O48_014578 [Marasmius crinis-equi]|uniref:Uncharacterized protein n=1 Tax=Marasmius crinis-equi TaxID=585013 RepID=A0ABR3EWX3_9AGAR
MLEEVTSVSSTRPSSNGARNIMSLYTGQAYSRRFPFSGWWWYMAHKYYRNPILAYDVGCYSSKAGSCSVEEGTGVVRQEELDAAENDDDEQLPPLIDDIQDEYRESVKGKARVKL